MNSNGGFVIAAYGAPPLVQWPDDGNQPTTQPTDFGRMLDQYGRDYVARFPLPPKPMPETAAAIVREQIEKLVRLRLSTAVTDEATRAELDAIIGALTVAVSVP